MIVCRPSVSLSVRMSIRPSVTLVDQDHIRWNSWKLIARTLSPTRLSWYSPKAINLIPEEHGEILGRLEVGWEKVACCSTKAAISLKTRKDKSYYRKPIRNHQRSFEWYHPPLSVASSSPKIGGSQPHPKLQSLLSQERVKLQHQIL